MSSNPRKAIHAIIKAMSLTTADIQKLASLSRMKLSDDEITQFATEIDSILGYVEQIKEVSGSGLIANADKKPSDIPHRNAVREDIEDQSLVSNPAVLVEAAPSSEGGLCKG